MTRDDVGRLAMWTALIVYFATWTVVPWLTLGANLWYVGVIWAVVYVLAHVIEIVAKGHCYLSADSTAFPAVIAAGILLGLVLSVSDVASVTANRAAYVRAFVMSFILGHVLSIAYSAAVTGLLGRLASEPKATSSRSGGPWAPRHEGIAALARTEKEVKRRKGDGEKE